jgi:hypothetical protein
MKKTQSCVRPWIPNQAAVLTPHGSPIQSSFSPQILSEPHLLLIQALHERGGVFLDDHLVQRQSACLVRAENVHAGKVLNGGKAGDNGTVLGELP